MHVVWTRFVLVVCTRFMHVVCTRFMHVVCTGSMHKIYECGSYFGIFETSTSSSDSASTSTSKTLDFLTSSTSLSFGSSNFNVSFESFASLASILSTASFLPTSVRPSPSAMSLIPFELGSCNSKTEFLTILLSRVALRMRTSRIFTAS